MSAAAIRPDRGDAARAARPRGIPGVDLSGLRYELPALLAFLWRTTGRRERASLLVVVVVAVCVAVGVPAAATVAQAGTEVRQTLLLLLPVSWAFFAVSVLVSAVAAAGGRELLPRSQALAFPVSPATDHAGALLTIPLNLAWTLQSVGLLTAVAVIAAGSPARLVQSTAMTLLWIIASSCLAHFTGWAAEVVRTFPSGETVLRCMALLLVGTAGFAVVTGRAPAALNSLPTTFFVTAAISTNVWYFVVAATGLVVVATVSFVGAVPLVALLSRRPTPMVADQETKLRRRAPDTGSDHAWAVRLDRRMVLRAAPLRRGLAILTLLPMGVTLLVPLPWTAITILPALVASASGLLYGVNAFALDGSGALWRDSLPQQPQQWLDVRLSVLLQVCGGGAVALACVAAVRSAAAPSAAELLAVACAAVVATVQVTTRCARWSVRRPFAAQLRSSRDAPAPPVALAGYAVSLAVATTLSATCFALAGSTGNVALPVAVMVPFLLSGVWSLRRSAEAFSRPSARARVAVTVAGA